MYALKSIFGGLIGLIILVLVTDISISNSHETTVHLWPFGELAILPLWLIVLGCFSGGLIIGGILLWPKLFMARLRAHQLSRRIARLEGELLDQEDMKATDLTTTKDPADG
jgi:uncharacterized integral membrane protein